MKVLFLSEEVVEVCDGRLYSMNLTQHLVKYQYFGEVVCVCYKKNVTSSKWPEVNKNNAEFVFVEKEYSFRGLTTISRKNDRIIYDLVNRKDIDAIICHVPSSNSSHAIRWAKKIRKPYLLVVVGCSWDALWNYNWKGKFMALPYYLRLRKQVSEASFALYVTRNFLQERYPTKGQTENASNVCIEIVPRVVLQRRLAKIASYSINSQYNIVTTAAVNVKYKGQQYVMKAIRNLNIAKGYNFHYYLIGGGDQSRLSSIAKKLQIEDYIHFMGALPHDKVTSALDDMDIYVQPSKQEGLPRALIEGMSRGLPAIGSKVAGIPELLPDSCLFKKGNSKQIEALLESFITTGQMADLAQNNFEKAKEYTIDVINNRRQHFFDQFITFCNR